MTNHTPSDPADTVMVVDDDDDIRAAIGDTLEMDGYRVVMAADGVEALDRLRTATTRPCAILLDLMMPRMDGASFRAAQQRDPALAAIPVIIVSADTRLEQRAAELGTAGCLPKPFGTDDLLKAVGRFCECSLTEHASS